MCSKTNGLLFPECGVLQHMTNQCCQFDLLYIINNEL